jgi:putative NADPH-quinone reductase
MPRDSKRIVIVQGHPDPMGGHFGHALADAYFKGASEIGHEVQLISVAQLDFPLLRSRADQQGQPPQAIVQAQADITHADHVVMIFPLWNGGAPACLKGFLEQTIRPAFIFPDSKPGEPLGFSSYFTQRKALKGKTAHIVVTMQMPAFVYRWYFRPHAEKNMLRVSGMSPVTESLVGGVEGQAARKRERWLHRMHALGGKGR